VLTETVDLIDSAIATSAGAGFRFDSQGRFTHLFDPATGRSPSHALSTAFSLMPVSRIRSIVAVRPNVQVHITDSGGTIIIGGA
jgi:thiamine biosynthesis lipoprotein